MKNLSGFNYLKNTLQKFVKYVKTVSVNSYHLLLLRTDMYHLRSCTGYISLFVSLYYFALYRHWHLTISTMASGAAGTSVVVGFELYVIAVSVVSILPGVQQFLLGNCSLAQYCSLNTGPQHVLFDVSQVRR